MRPVRVATLVACLATLGSHAAVAQATPSRPDSAKGAPPPPDRIQARVSTRVTSSGTGGSIGIQLNAEDFTRSEFLRASADSVWAVLPAVFAELKLPVNVRIQNERRIGLQAVRVRDQLGRERASKSLSCGKASDGREAADGYELFVDVTTIVVPEQDHSTLYSAVQAVAKPVFTSGEPVRCISTGRLEDRIAKAVQARLVAP